MQHFVSVMSPVSQQGSRRFPTVSASAWLAAGLLLALAIPVRAAAPAFTLGGVSAPTTINGTGYNSDGQLGNGNVITPKLAPGLVSGLAGVSRLTAGDGQSLAVTPDGRAWAWGLNNSGQLGDGTLVNRSLPAVSASFGTVSQLAGGRNHTLALRTDQTVWAAGYGAWGALGNGGWVQSLTPVPVSGLSPVIQIAAGAHFSLALQANGQVRAWGYGSDGQMGDGTTSARNTPATVSGLSGVIAIAAGAFHAVAVTSLGEVYTWGYNAYGQLGDNTTTSRSTPVKVNGLSGVTAVAAGENHTLALLSNGTVVAWGRNSNGQLGDGTTLNRLTPVSVSGLTGVGSISARDRHNLARGTDGTLRAWGYNGTGQLGDNTIIQRTTPILVTSLTQVLGVAAGEGYSLAFGVPANAPVITVPEDAGPKVYPNYAALTTPANGSVTYTVANNNPTLFTSAPTIAADGTLTFTSAPDAFGTASVTVLATDAGGASLLQAFTIVVTSQPETPVVTLTGAVSYTAGTSGVLLDTTATVADADTTVFNGGKVTVSYTSGGTATDQIAVVDQGNDLGQIGVAAGVVSYGGNVIGTVPTSGEGSGVGSNPNGTALIVTFTTANATTAAVQALVRRLSFANSSGSPSSTDRVLAVSVTDETALTGTAAKTVQILNVPPMISTGPVGGTVTSGATVTLTVTAIGTSPLTYVWKRGTTVVQSGASASFTLAPARVADAGDYTVTVSNGAGSVTSSIATLVVQKANPVITWAAPASVTYGTALSAAQLNATADQTGAFVYSPTAGTVLGAGVQTLGATFTPTDTDNYNVVSATLSLTVNPRAATVAANAKSKTYGTANPTLDATVSTLVGSDTLNYSLGTTATDSSGVGDYPITVTLGVNPNYTVTKTDGTLTVNPKAATVAANAKSKTYGDANPTLDATVSTLVGDDSLNYTLATTATASSGAGDYPITVTLGANPNYTVTKTDGTLTVNPKAATVAANAKSKTYGDANPAFDATVSALVGSDTLNYTLATTATASSGVGDYAITVTLGANPNYAVTKTDSTLTISPKAATVAANAKSKTYGDANPALDATVSTLVGADSLNYTLATTATASSIVGGYPITVTLGANPNYTVTKTDGTLTVTKAALVVTPANQSKAYGAAVPSLTGTLETVRNSDNITATYTAIEIPAGADPLVPASASTPVGSYDITAALSDPDSKLGNYNVTLNTGTLTVTKAVLTVTAGDKMRLYGSVNPDLTYLITGFVLGEDTASANVTGAPVLSTTALTTSPVGSYPITAADGGSGNGTSGGSSSGGSGGGTSGGSSSGGSGGGTSGGSSSGGSGGGTNEGNNSGGGGSGSGGSSSGGSGGGTGGSGTSGNGAGALMAANYSFAFVAGTLTVTRTPLSVTADSFSRAYGAANPDFTGSLTGLQNDDNITATYATTATPTSPVGGYAITPTLADPDGKLENYTVTSTSGALTVTKAVLTVTAVNQSKVYGSANPTLTHTLTGFVNSEMLGTSGVTGSPSITCSANAASTVAGGPYVITAAAGTLAAGNYSFTFVNGALAVTPATLTITAASASRVYGAANPTFTGTITGLQNSDNITATYATTANMTSPAGDYPIVPTTVDPDGKAGNYTIGFVNGTLTVNKAALTVTADNASRAYGAAAPAYTATITGFQNGDLAGVVSGAASFSDTSTATSAAGTTHPITPALGSLSAANYSFTTFVNGTLTITKAALTVAAVNQSKTFGSHVPALTYAITGYVNNESASVVSGTPVLATTVTPATTVGTGTITVDVSPLTAANYSFTPQSGSLAITAATTTVAWANPAPITYGTALGSSQLNATASGPSAVASAWNGGNDADVLVHMLDASGLGVTDLDFSKAFPGVATATTSDMSVFIEVGDPALDAWTVVDVTDVTLGSSLNFAGLTRSFGAVTGVKAVRLTAYPAQANAFSGFTGGTVALLGTADLTAAGTFIYTPAAGSTSLAVGNNRTLATVFEPTDATTYNSSTGGALINVTRAALSVTAASYSRPYGAANPTLTGTVTGVQNGDNITASYTTVATTASAVGSYSIVPSFTAVPPNKLANYNITYVNGTLTVNKAVVTVTADDKSKVYGSANPTFTPTYSGFQNGQTFGNSGASGAPGLSSLADETSAVGSYTITATTGTLSAGNYSFVAANGMLSITKAAVTVTAVNASKVYGSANPTFTASYSGFQNGQDVSTGATGSPSLTTTANDTSPVAGSPYTITAALGTLASGNYSFSFVNGALNVTRAPLTVTANAASRAYGASAPAYTATITGFITGENSGVVSGVPSFTDTSAASSAAGTTYVITPALGTLSAANYTFTTFVNGVLTINKAVLTVTADDKSKVYGSANPDLTASYTGFANDETLATSGVTGTPELTTTADAMSGVANYTITAAAGDLAAGNYSFAFVNGTLSVTKAVLTVTADNQSKVYGSANPPLTYTFSDFVNGENLGSSGVTGTPALNTSAGPGSAVGGYAITAAAGSLMAANYSFTFVSGTLGVTKALLTVTAENKSKVYGDANPTLTAGFMGFANGETLETSGVTGAPALATAADATSGVGGYTITAAAGGLAAANYSFAFANGTLSVTKALLTVTADNKSRAYRSDNPMLTASYAGFKNGEVLATSGVTGSPALATAADASSPAGAYDITAAAGDLAAANYSFSFANGTLTVTKAVLTVTAEDKSKTYGAANPTLTYTLAGFVLGENATSANVTGTPVLSTTALTGSPVVMGGYPITVTAGTLAAANYSFTTLVNGTLTINPAALTITADNKSRAYGAANPTLTAAYTGLVNGDTPASLTTPPTLALTTALDATSPAGSTSAITASGAASPNYTISHVSGTLTVTKAALVVTPANQTKVYGAAVPELTGTLATVYNNDGITATYTAAGNPGMGVLTFVRKWGSNGSGDGQFDYPRGVAVDGAGNVYVADTFHHRIQKFNSAGEYQAQWGGFGSANGQFDNPEGLAVDGAGNVYVADSNNHRIQKFNSAGEYQTKWGTAGNGNGQFNYPRGVAVDGAGNVYVADSFNHRIQKFTSAGAYQAKWGTEGNGNGQFNSPTGVAVDGAGNVYVADTSNNRIQKFTSAGEYQAQWGSIGGGDGQFTYPQALAVDAGGNVYVADTFGHRIQKFNSAGAYQAQWGTYGTGDGQFDSPLGVAVDAGGNVYVSDTSNHRIQKFSSLASASTPVGSYAITATLSDPNSKLGNYEVTLNTGTLTVTPAALTVTADNKTKLYGAANPFFYTYVIAGYVLGEDATSAGVTGSPVLTASATTVSAPGAYAITVAVGTLAAANYSFTPVNGTLTVTTTASTVSVGTGLSGSLNDSVVVPVKLTSVFGNENTLTFTLNFDAALLTYSGESGGPALSKQVNVTAAGSGKIGVSVAHGIGSTFSAGESVVINLNFSVVSAASVAASLTFGDSVVPRQVSDNYGFELPATYTGGTVLLNGATGGATYEADVNGDGAVTATDVAAIGSYAAGLVAVPAGVFQRADCAPRSTLGGGAVGVIDYVQAARYAAGLDPLTAVGGPTEQGGDLLAVKPSKGGLSLAGTRALQLASAAGQAGQIIVLPVTLTAQGNENALGFSLTFDPAQMQFVSIAVGGGAAGATVFANTLQAAAGRVGLIVALPAGTAIGAGVREVARATFRVAPGAAGGAAVSFGDLPIMREVVDVNAGALLASHQAAAVTVLAGTPTLRAQATAQTGAAGLRLSLGSPDGGQMSPERLARMEVWIAPSLNTPAGGWTLLPNALEMVNGQLQLRDTGATGATGGRFYKLIER